ncbi:MAG TPA: FHA domain-containing protein [Crinalium sp.]|jgi:pSer/pThr/pTyr-binding forkhead associated (FHA) protein
MARKSHQDHFLLVEDDKGQRQFALQNATHVIGRDRQCDIRLASHFVSREHATLRQQTQADGSYSYEIIDGSPDGRRSSNGLLINGRKLQSHRLQNQDVIVFGPSVKATYLKLERDIHDTIPPCDEFEDITLINPRTAGVPEG